MGLLRDPVAGRPWEQMMGRRSKIFFKLNPQTH